MKKFKGFTLVELIVVIAIIGVLAAILVPNMMGYISKSKLSSANTAAKNVNTAVVAYIADQESMGKTPCITSGLTATGFEVKSAAAADGLQQAVKTALEGNSNMGYAVVGRGTIDGTDNVVWCQWGETSSASVWGQYPNAQADYTTFKNNTTKSLGTFVATW